MTSSKTLEILETLQLIYPDSSIDFDTDSISIEFEDSIIKATIRSLPKEELEEEEDFSIYDYATLDSSQY